ncbi:hypothetical protein R3P38DRAFT_3179675 [Favolaschia claudopus]|uniref:Uncharacterized protein n=1 Tax=Favolaschia claudopus TaxID=2862362 RepID=A0AAW0CMU0_9AGAR
MLQVDFGATSISRSGPPSAQSSLSTLLFENPSFDSPSDLSVLRGRELVRSRRRAYSNSRSRSPAQGHRSSSLPADSSFSATINPPIQSPYSGEGFNTSPCPGIILEWATPDRYPWGIHSETSRMNLPFTLDGFATVDGSPRVKIRSCTCTGSTGIAQPECSACRSVRVGQTLHTLEERSREAPPNIPYQYLTPIQLSTALRDVSEQKNEQHLKLAGCLGLNLQCGKKYIVYCPDPKHVTKRVATSERSQEGTVVDSTVLNRTIITQWLERLPSETKESVAILVDPANHQNVPRAYKLIRAVNSLGTESIPTGPNPSPTDISTQRAFALAGEMWSAFLDPFTDRESSLSERLASLSKFSHLAFVFYRQHGSSFLSNQLYGDLQALVKAAFFSIARQQELDPEQAFYLYQLGSDRLEETFAEVRTESHDSNTDSLQLSERLSTAADTVGIFDENPEWHQGHVRRSWSGKEADHVNPTYFTGDHVVKNVVLSTVWRSGCCAASDFLFRHGIDFDFDTVLSQEGVDMLRPNGGGVYPGNSTEKDRSIIEPTETPTVRFAASTAEMTLPLSVDGESEEEEEEDSMEDVDQAEPEDVPRISFQDLLPEPEEDDGDADNSPAASGSQSSIESCKSNDWLDYKLPDGSTKRLHKASILSSLFNSDFRHLSVDRLLRVRCYTKDGGKKPNLNHQEFSGEHSFNVHDIAVALIRAGDVVAAAVVKATVLEKDKRRVSQVDIEELGSMDSTVSITAQLLGLSTVEDGTRKALTVKIPGAFVHPLDAEIEEIKHLAHGPDRDALFSKHMPHVWAVSADDLSAVVTTMFNSLSTETVLKLLPKHGTSNLFPYTDRNGAQAFVIDGVTRTLGEKNLNAEKISCHQCHIMIKPDDARGHVGAHILKSIKGIREANLYEQVHSENPCGYCGRGSCTSDLSGLPDARAAPKLTSDCPRAHSFSYGHAKKYSANTPSTNVPIFCTLCIPVPPRKSPKVFWKYSMFAHIRSEHPRYWDDLLHTPVDLPEQLALDLAISREELTALGVGGNHSAAPVAATLAPAPRRGRKRPLEDSTNIQPNTARVVPRRKT